MMKYLFTLTLVIFLLGCNNKVPLYYDINYEGEDNYKSFYIVDTIEIKNPCRVYHQKYGGWFVLSEDRLKEYTNDIDFFLSPDVFILSTNPYSPSKLEDFDKLHHYPDYGGCEVYKTDLEYEGLEVIYKYTTEPKFLLALINTNHYHLCYNSYTYFYIPIEYGKITYIKMVFPLCQ